MKCNLHENCEQADADTMDVRGVLSFHCSDPSCMMGECAKVNGPAKGKAMNIGIGSAVDALKAGRRVAREGWNGKGMWLQIVQPTRPRSEPYVEMRTAQGTFIPWNASQADLLATDYVIFDEDTQLPDGVVAKYMAPLPKTSAATGVHPRYMAPQPKERPCDEEPPRERYKKPDLLG